MLKKIDFLNRVSIRVTMILIIACSIVTSCSAQPNKLKKNDDFVLKDSVMRKAVGDSIYSILTKAKSVSASVKLKAKDNKSDSIVTVKVNKNDKYVLNFILTAPSNYETNDTVYGKYLPNFSLKFTASKGKVCTANFDFGLRKWNICDSQGKEIVIYDLPTNDVLRLANQLFPNCEYFNVLLNTPIK